MKFHQWWSPIDMQHKMSCYILYTINYVQINVCICHHKAHAFVQVFLRDLALASACTCTHAQYLSLPIMHIKHRYIHAQKYTRGRDLERESTRMNWSSLFSSSNIFTWSAQTKNNNNNNKENSKISHIYTQLESFLNLIKIKMIN